MQLNTALPLTQDCKGVCAVRPEQLTCTPQMMLLTSSGSRASAKELRRKLLGDREARLVLKARSC